MSKETSKLAILLQNSRFLLLSYSCVSVVALFQASNKILHNSPSQCIFTLIDDSYITFLCRLFRIRCYTLINTYILKYFADTFGTNFITDIYLTVLMLQSKRMAWLGYDSQGKTTSYSIDKPGNFLEL